MAQFFGKSRSQKRAENNLGIVHVGANRGTPRSRSRDLEIIDKYLEGTQYDGLADWKEAECSEDYIPIKKRKPYIIYPYAKVLQNRISAKLLGRNVFPDMKIEESDSDNEFLDVVLKATHFQPRLLQASKLFASHGSVFVRFKLDAGQMILEHYNPKWCYPRLGPDGELMEMRIKYVYKDPNDLDEKGRPKEKWYRLDLTKMADVLYDNPEFKADAEPVFTQVSRTDHELGFVQGEWMRTTENRHKPDGENMIIPILGFIDALNYNLSQSDRAVSYGLDPQLAISGIDEEELEGLLKSAFKAWNLGRDGDAKFLEVNGSGVQRAEEARLSFVKNLMDITRVLILDPEKIVGSAQSAKAMEVLHGPMLELINELRPQLQKGMIRLIQKMMSALVIFNQRGEELAIKMPPQYKPTSFDITMTWPQVFPLTIQDMQQLISAGATLANNNIASRKTVLQWLMAKGIDLGVEDVDAEVNEINNQQQFGGFVF